jgi:hypothetical protein
LHVGGGRVLATTQLRKEMAEMARSLKEYLDNRGEDTVAMGQFVGPPQLATSGGPLLAKLLAEELTRLKVNVKTRARLGLKGEYLDVIDQDSKQVAIQVKVKLVERNKTLLDLDRGVLTNPDIAVLLGATARLDPNATDKGRNDQITSENPPIHFVRNWIATNEKGPYAIQIQVQGQARTPTKQDGLAYVKIDQGEVYTVKLSNQSSYDAAVLLTIDGINTFSFSDVKNADGSPAYEYIILPKKSVVEIKGWHRTNEVSEGFQVTEFSKSAAAYLQSTANVGTITAMFHAAWVKNGPTPPDERPGRNASATGFGPPVDASYRVMPREIGVARDIISVRYQR